MINLKKEFHTIEKIFSYLKIDMIEEIGITTFLNKDTIFVKTADDSYYINVVSLKDKPSDYSKTQISKVKCLEFFNKNGVYSFLPMNFNDKIFIDFRNKEYEIYRFRNVRHLNLEDLSTKQFKKIATTQAIIHKLNVNVNIPCDYNEIKLPPTKKIAKLEKYSPDGYKLLYEYIYTLEEIFNHYNKLLKYIKNYLVVGYDNYDLNNIEWVEGYMYLVDYNNCKLINPAVSLAEAAFSFSYNDEKIDYPKYNLYLETYIKRYGSLTSDFKEALYVSQGKRLEKLVNSINESLQSKENCSFEIIKIIKELLLFNANIERMYDAYIKIVKK